MGEIHSGAGEKGDALEIGLRTTLGQDEVRQKNKVTHWCITGCSFAIKTRDSGNSLLRGQTAKHWDRSPWCESLSCAATWLPFHAPTLPVFCPSLLSDSRTNFCISPLLNIELKLSIKLIFNDYNNKLFHLIENTSETIGTLPQMEKFSLITAICRFSCFSNLSKSLAKMEKCNLIGILAFLKKGRKKGFVKQEITKNWNPSWQPVFLCSVFWNNFQHCDI